jgi:hypothetical protein
MSGRIALLFLVLALFVISSPVVKTNAARPLFIPQHYDGKHPGLDGRR